MIVNRLHHAVTGSARADAVWDLFTVSLSQKSWLWKIISFIQFRLNGEIKVIQFLSHRFKTAHLCKQSYLMKSVVTWEERSCGIFLGWSCKTYLEFAAQIKRKRGGVWCIFFSNTMLLNIRAKKPMEITNITLNFRSKSLPKWNSKSSVIQDQMCSITELLKEWHMKLEAWSIF